MTGPLAWACSPPPPHYLHSIYTIYTTEQVDAAFVWSGNDKIYFFKGAKYWRFDPEARPPVELGYPRPLSNWDGIPG